MKRFLDELFPSRYVCMACGREYGGSDLGLCDECFKRLPFVKSPCVKCGRNSKTPHCSGCLRHRRHFELSRSVFDYSGRIREVYLTYKFGEKRYLAPYFARFLANAYYGMGVHCDCVCGIPEYSEKKRRKPNHSELLAKTVAELLGLPLTDGLRKKKVPKQVGLDREERIKNAADAYYAEGDGFVGKVVLVIDDVFTTGSTIDSVAKTLRKAGAKKVYGLTIFSVGEEDAE